ncbi:MAG: GNAT family N-acetyltransferase [Pseudomonadales bacterium]|nr:GNAT family N-acetyltransferase [Pseudomonadales bacterium]
MSPNTIGGGIVAISAWLMHGRPKHGLVEFEHIAIMPEYRRKGIAKKLFEQLITHTQQYYKKKGGTLRKIYLLTRDENTEAQAFYCSLGFVHETTLKEHFCPKKDDYVFSYFVT